MFLGFYCFVCFLKRKSNDYMELGGKNMGVVEEGKNCDQNILYEKIQLKIK